MLGTKVIKVRFSLSKNLLCSLSWKHFKNDENCFLFYLKSSFCSQDIQIFVLAFLGHVDKKGLKDKVNIKIYEVKTWLTNIYYPHIAQYLRIKVSQTMKFGQIIKYDKTIFRKIMQKLRLGNLFKTCLCFLKKLYMR